MLNLLINQNAYDDNDDDDDFVEKNMIILSVRKISENITSLFESNPESQKKILMHLRISNEKCKNPIII